MLMGIDQVFNIYCFGRPKVKMNADSRAVSLAPLAVRHLASLRIGHFESNACG